MWSSVAKDINPSVTTDAAATADLVAQALDANPNVSTVLVTHNETSTGITNDMETIAKIVKKEFNKLILVDAISSLGSIRLPVDEWDLDVVCAGVPTFARRESPTHRARHRASSM